VHPTPGHLSAPPMAQAVAISEPLAAPPQQPIGAATMMGVPSGLANAPTAASPVLDPDRSPWAPPSTVPPASNAPPSMPAPMPAPMPPVVAAPVVAAPVVAAPVVAPTIAPSVAPPGPVASAVDTAALVPPPAAPMAPVLPQAPVVAPPKVTNAPAKPGAPAEQKGKFRETMWFKKGDLDAQAAVAAAEERARTGKDVGGEKADSLPMDERYKDDGSISRGDKDKYSLRTGATQMMSAVNPASSMSGKVSEDALIGEMKKGRSTIFILIGLGVVGLALLIFLLAR
jgi:hypothetical protein